MAHLQQQTYFPSNDTFAAYYPSGTGHYPGDATLLPLNGPTGSATIYQQAPHYPHASPSARRRSSSSTTPYPTSLHDCTRLSPTRTRFNVNPPQTPIYDPSSSHTPRSRQNSTLGPDRHARNFGRQPQDENGYQPPKHVVSKSPSKPRGPSNHLLVPQGIFAEPASSSLHHYRYEDIFFKLAGFPEKGVKISNITGDNPALVDWSEDLVFREVTERELKVQIIWPGYKPFEKRVKTQKGMLTRGMLAGKLASMVLDFANQVKQTRIDSRHHQWKLSPHHEQDAYLASDVFITKLFHCGGCHWQMELWVPLQSF